MLCISTSDRVLHMPFVGWNQFFEAKTALCVLLSHKMYKINNRYSISNINQQLTICQQMLKMSFFAILWKKWYIYSIFFVYQFGRLKLGQGAIYHFYISVVITSFQTKQIKLIAPLTMGSVLFLLLLLSFCPYKNKRSFAPIKQVSN